jgi:hypothetical protein
MEEKVGNVVGKEGNVHGYAACSLGLAKHLLDWAGVHTGHSAEAAATIAAEVVAVAGVVEVVVVAVAAAAVVAAVEAVAHWESAAVAAAVVAQAGSGSSPASQRAAGSSCYSWLLVATAATERGETRRRGRAVYSNWPWANATVDNGVTRKGMQA